MNRLFSSAFVALLVSACGGAATQNAATTPALPDPINIVWQQYSPEGSGVRVDMPGVPEQSSRHGRDGREVPIATVQLTPQFVLTVSVVDVPVDGVGGKPRDELYDALIAGGARGMSCTVSEAHPVMVGTQDGREASLACGENNVARIRISVAQNRIFMFFVLGSAEEIASPITAHFFDSIQFESFADAPLPPTWVTLQNGSNHARFEVPENIAVARDVEGNEGFVNSRIWTAPVPESRITLLVGRDELAPTTTPEEPTARARRAIDLTRTRLASLGWTNIEETTRDGWPAIASTMDIHSGIKRRVFAVAFDNVVYVLAAFGTPQSLGTDAVTRFFESAHADPFVAPPPAAPAPRGRRR